MNRLVLVLAVLIVVAFTLGAIGCSGEEAKTGAVPTQSSPTATATATPVPASPPATHEPTPSAMPTSTVQQITPVPTPTPAPTPASTAGPISEKTLASNFGFLGTLHDPEELRELGVIWDRPHPGPFIWGSVEKEEGLYDWAEVDYYVAWSQWYGFSTLATIWPFAQWDQAKWEPSGTPPGTSEIVFEAEMGRSRREPYDLEAYRRFVSALVERYDGDGEADMPGLKYPIKYWEAGNEPSMQDGFNMFFSGSSQDYLDILEATYRSVKEADPEAKILHAGMAGMDPRMVAFWKPIFENGSQYFDIANIHSIGASDELNVPEFKALLLQYDIAKPIWVTEAQHRMGRTHDGRYISQEEHGRIFMKSYVLCFACGVEKIFYTSFKAPPFSDEEFDQSALIDKYGTERPAYHALRTLIRKLDGFTSAEKLDQGQYKFVVDGKTIYVLWASGAIPEQIAGDILVTDIYGTETSSNSQALTLTESPVFVETIQTAEQGCHGPASFFIYSAID